MALKNPALDPLVADYRGRQRELIRLCRSAPKDDTVAQAKIEELTAVQEEAAAEIEKVAHVLNVAQAAKAAEKAIEEAEKAYGELSDEDLEKALAHRQELVDSNVAILKALKIERRRRVELSDADREIAKLSPAAKRLLRQRIEPAPTETTTKVSGV